MGGDNTLMADLGVVLKRLASTSQTYDGAVQSTYSMQVNNLVIQGDKNPLAIPLPSNAQQILIDLGFSRFTIQIQGLVDETAGTDGANTVPNKENLEDFCLSNHTQDRTIEITASGSADPDVYGINIRSLRFTLTAAQENRWEYLLVFNATKRITP